jgi:hypothetical protein
MLFNLNVLDTSYNPLDVANALIHSESPNLVHNNTTFPNAGTINLPVTLQAGNTYDIVFPPSVTVLAGSSVMQSDPLDIGSIPLSSAFLQAGGTIQITPTVNITALEFAPLTVVPVVGAPQAVTQVEGQILGFTKVTTPAPHGLVAGNQFGISGSVPPTGVGSFTVFSVISPTEFTYTGGGTSPGDLGIGGTFSFHDYSSVYNESVEVRGEDITITIDWGAGSQVFEGTNIVSGLVIPDNSVVNILVESAGMYTYDNTISVYTNEETGSVLMQPVIIDPMDVNFRRPYPNFFTIIEPCTFNVHIYDGQSLPFGMLNYYQGGKDGELFSSGQRNYIYDVCEPNIISIGQEIVVRAIPNCGGSSPIIWDRYTSPTEVPPYSWFEIIGIETVEYKPVYQIDNEFRCAVAINEEIVIAPELINMNNVFPHATVCDVFTDEDVALTYTLLTPSLEIIELSSYTAQEIFVTPPNPGPLPGLSATFTPDQLGTYVLTVELTNCCDTIVNTYNINIADSWQITNENCNEVVITNIGAEFTLTYTLRELTDNDIFEIMTIDNVLQENIPLSQNDFRTIDLIDDGIYTFDLITNAPGDTVTEKVFLMDCNIKKCKKEFLLAVTCPPAICDDLAKIELWKNYVHFKTLEEIVYYRWDEWIRQQSVFPTFSINDIMEDVLSIKDVIAVNLDKIDFVSKIY